MPWLTLHLCVWHILWLKSSLKGSPCFHLICSTQDKFQGFQEKKCNCIWDEYSLRGIVNKLLSIDKSFKPFPSLRKCFWHLINTYWTLKRNIFNSCNLYLVLFGLINRTYTQITLPWSTCPIGADNVTVVECVDSSETQYFWFRLKSSLFANLNFSFFYSQIFSFDCKLLGLLWMRRGALV